MEGNSLKNFVIITGPQAVGKMAVGMALREKENYRLFHNHMTIEFVKELYGYMNKEARVLVNNLREAVFKDVLEKEMNFTYTYMWGFNLESEYVYIDDLIRRFEENNWCVTIVELEADVETRLARNGTELRLHHKATKRDLEWSNNELVKSLEKYRLNSNPGEITHPNYIRINNENKSPDEVADEILAYLNNL